MIFHYGNKNGICRSRDIMYEIIGNKEVIIIIVFHAGCISRCRLYTLKLYMFLVFATKLVLLGLDYERNTRYTIGNEIYGWPMVFFNYLVPLCIPQIRRRSVNVSSISNVNHCVYLCTRVCMPNISLSASSLVDSGTLYRGIVCSLLIFYFFRVSCLA